MNPPTPKSYRSLIFVCLASALVGSVITGLPLCFKLNKQASKLELAELQSNEEWSDAFMTVLRLSASGKLKVVDNSKPWLLQNASAHDCVIVGARVFPTEPNSSVFNVEFPSIDNMRNAISGKVGRAWVGNYTDQK